MPHTRINFKLIKNLTGKNETMVILEENIGDFFYEYRERISNCDSKSRCNKEKTNTFDYMKNLNFAFKKP